MFPSRKKNYFIFETTREHYGASGGNCVEKWKIAMFEKLVKRGGEIRRKLGGKFSGGKEDAIKRGCPRVIDVQSISTRFGGSRKNSQWSSREWKRRRIADAILGKRFNWSLSGYSLPLSLSLLFSVQLTLITLNYDNNDVSESNSRVDLPRSAPVDEAKKLSALNRIAKNLSDANCRNSLLGREL